MADYDDDVVVEAASFLYFFNEDNANEENASGYMTFLINLSICSLWPLSVTSF